MSLDAVELDSGCRGDTAPMQARTTADAGRKLRLLTLNDLDGRTRAKQRAEELRERLISERGGADRIDIIRTAHINTWTVLTAIIEDQVTRYMLGEPIELAGTTALVNTRRREGEVIGEPEPRDVTPDLRSYIAAKATEKPAGESAEADV